MRFSTYSNYQETDFYWLGKIPSSWQIKRVGHHTDFITGFAFKSDLFSFEKGIKLVRGDNVTEGSLRWGDKTRFWSEITKELEQYLLKDKDLLIGMDGSKVGKNFTLIKESDLPLLLVQRVARLRTDDQLYYKFLSYLIGSELFRIWVTLVKTDPAIPHISPSDIRGFPLPFPSYDEQTQIAAFLDHETAKIDTLIEKQQQLIELLKEKRQAEISHAVTKGLNPDAPMKDSGVEWLGEVPEHWEVSRLGFHATKIGSGKTPKGGAEIYQDSGVLFIRSQNVYDDGLRIAKSESVYINESIHHEMAGTSVLDGDVLLNITGGSIGRSCLVPTNFPDANVNQHVCILRFPTSIREFISFVMKSNSIKEQIDAFQTGGNREGLNFEQIAKLKFTLPPLNEINSIIEHIKLITVTFNTLEEQAQQAIQLMQERRTALISAAVTGKIDVRNWVAPTAKTDTAQEAETA